MKYTEPQMRKYLRNIRDLFHSQYAILLLGNGAQWHDDMRILAEEYIDDIEQVLIRNDLTIDDMPELTNAMKEDVRASTVYINKIFSESKIWWKHRSMLKRLNEKLRAGIPLTERQSATLMELVKRYAPQMIKNNFL